MLEYSLPAKQYCIDEIYEEERTSVFTKNWILVAHCQEIPKTGDQIARTIANYPILLINTPNGIAAYINVCLHRAGPLMWDGSKGNEKVLRCRYHGWTYDWDGNLTFAPDFGADCPKGQLQKLHVSIVAGMIFICIEPPQYTLEETFPSLWRGLQPFSLEKMKLPLKIQFYDQLPMT